MSTGPMTVSSRLARAALVVAAALLITNMPFGFVALLGVIALAGIIMRNSVILVDQIRQDIEDGHTPWMAVIDATVRRSRPIVLTAAAAILAPFHPQETTAVDLMVHGATVLGVSPDGPESHAKFRSKYKLGFTLLADEKHAVAEKYGAWREKNMYGKKSMGIARSTFVIDAEIGRAHV